MKFKPVLPRSRNIYKLPRWIWVCAILSTLYFGAKAYFYEETMLLLGWAVNAAIFYLSVTMLILLIVMLFSQEKNISSLHPDRAKFWASMLSLAEAGKRIQQKENEEIAKRENIIHEYGRVMEENFPSWVADESKLPYPKQEIKKALISALRDEDDFVMKELLKAGYIQLANWQPNVGEKDEGFDISNIDTGQDIKLIAKQFVIQTEGVDFQWPKRIAQEREELKRELRELGLWEI